MTSEHVLCWSSSVKPLMALALGQLQVPLVADGVMDGKKIISWKIEVFVMLKYHSKIEVHASCKWHSEVFCISIFLQDLCLSCLQLSGPNWIQNPWPPYQLATPKDPISVSRSKVYWTLMTKCNVLYQTLLNVEESKLRWLYVPWTKRSGSMEGTSLWLRERWPFFIGSFCVSFQCRLFRVAVWNLQVAKFDFDFPPTSGWPWAGQALGRSSPSPAPFGQDIALHIQQACGDPCIVACRYVKMPILMKLPVWSSLKTRGFDICKYEGD